MPRHCKHCNQDKPLSDFRTYSTSGNRKAYRANVCRSCKTSKNKAWKQANKDKISVYNRRAQLKSDYGLTETQFTEMAAAQGYRCASCNTPTDKFVVDHNHTTGHVRGLLCGPCNLGIGHFFDQPDLLERAADYLRRTADGDRTGSVRTSD